MVAGLIQTKIQTNISSEIRTCLYQVITRRAHSTFFFKLSKKLVGMLYFIFFTRSNIPEDCRALSHEDGFGDIDASHVVLHRNPAAKGAAVNGMAAAMREAFSATQPALS